MEIRNKVVWITGASSGIGEALTYKLNELGAKLILSSRNRESLYVVKSKCKINPLYEGTLLAFNHSLQKPVDVWLKYY